MALSYHGDPAIKAAHIAQAQHHADADMLLAAAYSDEYRAERDALYLALDRAGGAA